MFHRPWHLLKRLLLLFWAVWLTIVVFSNVADALREARILGAKFYFASGNYPLVREVIEPADLPDWVARVLFGGVIVWETAAAILFAVAALTFRGGQDQTSQRAIVAAFGVALGLWAAFQIACEMFPSVLAYQLAGTHRLLFIETLASLLAMILLPDD